MSKVSASEIFEWDELWAGFMSQPSFIQRVWFIELSKEGNLPKVMRQTQKVKDEVFANAPEWVQKHFGYKTDLKSNMLDNEHEQLALLVQKWR